jgi:hypothetical protein
LRAKWLDPKELAHADGSPIEWEPGRAARSRFGTAEAQEPLIDLPEPRAVSSGEEAGYRRFATEYEQVWSDAIDPVALRLRPGKERGRTTLDADLRVLPLLRREYRDVTALVGGASTLVPQLESGARIVASIGKDARVRRELTSLGRDFGLGKQLSFDWLGDWVLVGTPNRNELSNAASIVLAEELEPPTRDAPQRRSDFDDLIGDLPIYGGIGIKSRLGASAMLTLLRKFVSDAAGGARWDAQPAHRGQDVVRVSPEREGDRIAVYYSLLDSAFVLSLTRVGVETAIDQVLDAPPLGKEAAGAARLDRRGPSGDQLTLDLAGAPGSALHRVGVWLATRELLRRSEAAHALAKAVLRGAPELAGDGSRVRALMRAYFGTVAVTPEGRDYRLAPDGIEDPLRGTYHAPAWPALPVPGSIVDRTLARLVSFRTGLSFEEEPGGTRSRPLESLHARMRFELSPAPGP